MLRLYIIGLAILVIAILANGLALKIGLKTWYDFIEYLTSSNNAEPTIKFIDFIWLFLIYPLILGCGYWLGNLLYNTIMK